MEFVETLEKTTFCGRRFTRAQLARVQETVHTCPHLSRNELALTLCEHLDWTTPKGTYKVRSCLKLVEALEARGIICLPATRQKRASVHAAIPFKGPDAPIDTSLDALAPISLHPVTTAAASMRSDLDCRLILLSSRMPMRDGAPASTSTPWRPTTSSSTTEATTRTRCSITTVTPASMRSFV